MMRRSFLAGLSVLVVGKQAMAASTRNDASLPVPSWKPSFGQSLDRVVERIAYYTDGKRDFVIFQNGTCVILEDDLSDTEAKAVSLKVLSDIIHFHPDMNPSPMDDGNVLVRYNHPAANVVLRDVAEAHWAEIEANHLQGLAPSEVLMTPQGQNRFDRVGKQALLGRAYMFMDAQAPRIVRIVRHG
jgi:hypothetical protein